MGTENKKLDSQFHKMSNQKPVLKLIFSLVIERRNKTFKPLRN
jgi:hypothetical protein